VVSSELFSVLSSCFSWCFGFRMRLRSITSVDLKRDDQEGRGYTINIQLRQVQTRAWIPVFCPYIRMATLDFLQVEPAVSGQRHKPESVKHNHRRPRHYKRRVQGDIVVLPSKTYKDWS
jgi:hypothetical protein